MPKGLKSQRAKHLQNELNQVLPKIKHLKNYLGYFADPQVLMGSPF